MILHLAPEQAKRLAKVAARLASDHACEHAAAALLATRLLSGHGVSWSDLVAGAFRPHRPPVPSVCSPQALARVLLACHGAELSSWEIQFLRSIAGGRGAPTAKQMAVLKRTATCVQGAADA